MSNPSRPARRGRPLRRATGLSLTAASSRLPILASDGATSMRRKPGAAGFEASVEDAAPSRVTVSRTRAGIAPAGPCGGRTGAIAGGDGNRVSEGRSSPISGPGETGRDRPGVRLRSVAVR